MSAEGGPVFNHYIVDLLAESLVCQNQELKAWRRLSPLLKLSQVRKRATCDFSVELCELAVGHDAEI